jgi:hypothetical protein
MATVVPALREAVGSLADAGYGAPDLHHLGALSFASEVLALVRPARAFQALIGFRSRAENDHHGSSIVRALAAGLIRYEFPSPILRPHKQLAGHRTSVAHPDAEEY